LTERKHNYYIQGKMARERQFDKVRQKEMMDEKELPIEQDFMR